MRYLKLFLKEQNRDYYNEVYNNEGKLNIYLLNFLKFDLQYNLFLLHSINMESDVYISEFVMKISWDVFRGLKKKTYRFNSLI